MPLSVQVIIDTIAPRMIAGPVAPLMTVEV
jgi:hypothetical protein